MRFLDTIIRNLFYEKRLKIFAKRTGNHLGWKYSNSNVFLWILEMFRTGIVLNKLERLLLMFNSCGPTILFSIEIYFFGTVRGLTLNNTLRELVELNQDFLYHFKSKLKIYEKWVQDSIYNKNNFLSIMNQKKKCKLKKNFLSIAYLWYETYLRISYLLRLHNNYPKKCVVN